jgi:hypothetical protein
MVAMSGQIAGVVLLADRASLPPSLPALTFDL